MGLQTGRGDGAENTKWKFVFYARPHPDLLPRGEEIAGARFWFCGGAAGQSSRGFSKTAANVSPSLGEGRDEGGCEITSWRTGRADGAGDAKLRSDGWKLAGYAVAGNVFAMFVRPEGTMDFR